MTAHIPENDWIEWSGGECPIEAGARVWVKRRSGRIVRARVADRHWQHRHSRFDIVAYRVVSA